MALEIHTIVSLPFQENTYVVWRKERQDALVIDPGLEPDLILSFLEEQALTPVVILNTHGHADHIAGNEPLQKAFPDAPIVIGKNEAHLLEDAVANFSASFGFEIVSPPANRLVDEGELLDYAGIALEVFEIPGHSSGHVVYLFRDDPNLVFGGDVLFRGSVGRYDLPGGSRQTLLDGIRTKLFTLPPTTIVYPGHGPVTTVGHEQRTNPILR